MKKLEDDAHSLETALRIAQAQNRELRKLLEQTEDELDEARKWCNIHWEGLRSTGKHCADAMNELQKTTEERDEARKHAQFWRNIHCEDYKTADKNRFPWEQ